MGLNDQLLLRQMNEDRSVAAAMLFPHRHRHESPPFHVKLTDCWRSANELVVVEAFRGGAKTTLSEEFLLIEALFANFKYCLIFGETYTKACQRIESMKHEMMTNTRIRTAFNTGKGSVWSENKIVLPNGVCVEAHGWEEEIRGYLHLGSRPDRVYLDDIETQELVRDSATVEKQWRKLHTQLLPAIDSELGKVRMTGTPLADDCLIRRAAASKRWLAARFPVCDRDIDDPEAQSLWPSRYPMEWIRAKRDHMSEEGMLSAFNQEYMLIPTGAVGKPFDDTMLHYEDRAPYSYSPRVVIIDPARTVDVTKSDQTGHVTVSRIGTRIYVHESGGEYWQPDEIVQGAFDLSKRHDDAEVAIEKNSLDNWLIQPIRAMMLRTGRVLKLRTLNAPQDRSKSDFIMGLRSFFIAGDIILVGGRGKHAKLVSQILNFPSGKRDILNALAYCLRVFSGVPVYEDFGQANIVEGLEPASSATLVMGFNSSGGETTAILCAMEGSGLCVLADWISPLVPADAIPDIARLVRAAYPGRKVTAWVPADIADQSERNPLSSALKTAGLKPGRADHEQMSRGALTPMVRTEVRGRRLFRVASTAKNTLQALASGYNWPIKSNGEKAGEPEKNSARTLIVALECLTKAIERADTAANTPLPNAVNTMGVRYISALGR